MEILFWYMDLKSRSDPELIIEDLIVIIVIPNIS